MRKMKGIINAGLLVAQCLLFSVAIAQKPSITPDDYSKWYGLDDYKIDYSGTYAMYNIRNYPNGHNTTIVRSINGSWRLKLQDIDFLGFSESAPYFIYKSNDSIFVHKTGGGLSRYIAGVEINFLSGDLLVCKLKKTDAAALVIIDFHFGKEKVCQNAGDVVINGKTRQVLWQTVRENGSGNNELKLYNADTKIEKTIYHGSLPTQFCFDDEGRQIAIVKDKKVLVYNVINGSTKLLSSGSDLCSERLVEFNKAGDKLIVHIESVQSPTDTLSGIHIWRYNDSFNPLEKRFRDGRKSHTVTALLSVASGKLIHIETPAVHPYSLQYSDSNNHVVMINEVPDAAFYNDSLRATFSIFDTKSGVQADVVGPGTAYCADDVRISPNEAFIVFYEKRQKQYFSYEIATRIYRQVSEKVPYPLCDDTTRKIMPSPHGFCGWLRDENAVLLYDQYDIWKLDLYGKVKPVNITQGMGRKNHIIWSFSDLADNRIVDSRNDIVLAGFDELNKNNGFALLNIALQKFEEGALQPVCYQIPRVRPLGSAFPAGNLPVKAIQKNTWLVARMTASESLNLYATNNFKTFTRLSEIRPEKKYNWLTNELITWQLNDGTITQGMLYKPENFDPAKKYPIIFNYYERRSDELHQYFVPKSSKGVINIPSYVSNEYLVFVPDIPFKCGSGPGKAALETILSAVRMLGKYSWADTTRMGLQGHSFGGGITNYIIAHSKLFKAACESAGSSNWVSSYGQLQKGRGTSRQAGPELGFQACGLGLGKTPWTATDLYIGISPVFFLGNVTTPLLILHNQNDDAVPFEQGIEMFLGLKRAGKKVWMIQYDDGDHILYGASAVDFSIRMQQFFDHYLKNAAFPEWMSKKN
jgi:dipeptidyl aminopeptidase/acylaminoacyl peptidase